MSSDPACPWLMLADDACVATGISPLMMPILSRTQHCMPSCCRCAANLLDDTEFVDLPGLPLVLAIATPNSHEYYFRSRVKLLSSDMALLL